MHLGTFFMAERRDGLNALLTGLHSSLFDSLLDGFSHLFFGGVFRQLGQVNVTTELVEVGDGAHGLVSCFVALAVERGNDSWVKRATATNLVEVRLAPTEHLLRKVFDCPRQALLIEGLLALVAVEPFVGIHDVNSESHAVVELALLGVVNVALSATDVIEVQRGLDCRSVEEVLLDWK